MKSSSITQELAMPFKNLVRFALLINRYGYYTVRCMMLKQGASLQDIHKALAMRLRILGSVGSVGSAK